MSGHYRMEKDGSISLIERSTNTLCTEAELDHNIEYVDYTARYGYKPFEGSITAVTNICEDFIKNILHREHIIRIVVNKKKRATTVFWTDGTVTVVKRAKGDRDDLYHAVASAFAIKNFGSNSAFKKEIENAVEYLEK